MKVLRGLKQIFWNKKSNRDAPTEAEVDATEGPYLRRVRPRLWAVVVMQVLRMLK